MIDKAILIWKFEDAPKEYQELSENGGDEDWIAFVPKYLEDEYIGFLDGGTPFGCCRIWEHNVEGGKIVIGCHS